MTGYFIDDILQGLERWGEIVRVVIARTEGSSPRDAGACMIVGTHSFFGTIGGGRLEYLVLDEARGMIRHGGLPSRKMEHYVLGPEFRQCCGGTVDILLEYFGPSDKRKLQETRKVLNTDSLIIRRTNNGNDNGSSSDYALWSQDTKTMTHWSAGVPSLNSQNKGGQPNTLLKDKNGTQWFIESAVRKKTPLYLYGAGHVGRALVRVLEDTPFDITWVDTERSRFPDTISPTVKIAVAPSQADFAKTVRTQPACHVVVTFSHQEDYKICHAVLKAGNARYLGLIASKSKKARFYHHLKKDGIKDEAFGIFRCPIGLMPYREKAPAVIAISIASQLIAELEQNTCEEAIYHKEPA